jgi:hypothetical protein
MQCAKRYGKAVMPNERRRQSARRPGYRNTQVDGAMAGEESERLARQLIAHRGASRASQICA